MTNEHSNKFNFINKWCHEQQVKVQDAEWHIITAELMQWFSIPSHPPPHCGWSVSQQQEFKILSAKEEGKRKMTPSIQMGLGRHLKWGKLKSFIEKHHPNKDAVIRVMDLLMTIQGHIATKSSKEGKSKCHQIGSLMKVAQKRKECMKPIDSSDSVSDSGSCYTQKAPLSCLPHSSHEDFQRYGAWGFSSTA